MRFSRSSLNAIILGCIAIIAWISINETDKPAEPLLDVPPLPTLQFSHWLSDEGILAAWQYTNEDYRIRIQLQRHHNEQSHKTLPLQSYDWQLDNPASASLSQDDALKQALVWLQDSKQALVSNKNQYGAITIRGPWPDNLMRMLSARIIKELKLNTNDKHQSSGLAQSTQPSARLSNHQCPWQPVSAAIWLEQQLPLGQSAQPDVNQQLWAFELPQLPAIPNATLLNQWKSNYLLQTRQRITNADIQFDILSRVAYYRLPPEYLDQAYSGINELTTASLAQYLSQCQSTDADIAQQ